MSARFRLSNGMGEIYLRSQERSVGLDRSIGAGYSIQPCSAVAMTNEQRLGMGTSGTGWGFSMSVAAFMGDVAKVPSWMV